MERKGCNEMLCLVTFVLMCFTAMAWSQRPQQGSQVPCFFIFGDSLVDNGNNNRMVTLARANYRPYGIDFPLGTTGRFTNGRTYVDALVNFANTVQEMRRLFRGDNNALSSYLSKCIFYSGMGSNDYLNNYFMPNFYTTSSDYDTKAYAAVLVQDYARQLTQLYGLGARKVIVTAVGPIGCIPYQLARYHGNSSRCNEKINRAIVLFNSGLRKMVDSFNSGVLQGAKFVYLDSYKSSNDLYLKAASYGFEVIDKGCCGVGRNNGQITCLPLQQPCEDRGKYLFWDAFHPTEEANNVFANASFGSQSYTYPINIQQLASL
ncbi:hypothetical protein SLEP1_g43478 [Rubroshorea leprosula]|uniref:GDSL esterase/lipase n=1 Tax=Rubroshorea leprosula TaxID=152421 RepID=A0AAV5LDH3_9ROSI|nr:hypothetical protein SLEP1_g43478 [Rubroshorea leprosula]